MIFGIISRILTIQCCTSSNVKAILSSNSSTKATIHSTNTNDYSKTKRVSTITRIWFFHSIIQYNNLLFYKTINRTCTRTNSSIKKKLLSNSTRIKAKRRRENERKIQNFLFDYSKKFE